METIKVAFILYQTGNQANGGIASILEIITRLEKIVPVVITQKETEVNQQLREKGITVYVISPLNKSNIVFKFFNLLYFNLKVFSFLKREGISVTHVNDIYSLIDSLLAIKLFGSPLVFNIRDVLERNRNYGAKWKLTRFCDRIIVLSHSMKEELSRRLPLGKTAPDSLIVPIYSIVDFEIFKPIAENKKQALKKSLGLRAADFVLLYAATFNDKKNQLTFIREAVPEIFEVMPEAKICFVGDFQPGENPYARRCKEAVEQLGLHGNVHFEGFSGNIEQWYQVADVTVLASRREGMARCMIESVACGTPVVSFDVASAHEILEGYECGQVVLQGDYKSLVLKIKMLKENKELKETMGESGAFIAKKLFKAQTVVRDYENVYLSTMS